MLKILRINNFALIENLEIEFFNGLNILTGETGSGKSIILDALGLLLGERASADFLRTGAVKCQIEALFALETFPEAFKKLLSDSGIDLEGEEVIIRREVTSQGKSRIYINDSLSTLSTLKAMAYSLVDMYGQGDFQSLLRADEQRIFLDHFAGNGELLRKTSGLHQKLKEISEKRKNLLENEQDRLKRIDLLHFQAEEIDKINPFEDEDIELEQGKNLLANASRINELAQRCFGYLYEDDNNLSKLIKLTADGLNQLQNIDSRTKSCFEQMNNLRFSVQDISYYLRDYLEKLEFDPQRLEMVEERLHLLERLKRKYGRSINEVLAYRRKIAEELENLSSFEDHQEKLKREYEELFEQYLKASSTLSESRAKTSGPLEARLEKELAELAMEKIRFQIRIQTCIPDKEDLGLNHLAADGIDQVEFYVAVNAGEELKPLSKTASGGELSRIMLALKCIASGKVHADTLIFDEVDAGIGGGAAGLVGKKLKAVSKNHQVICVTHMPQIASCADRHFQVYKEEISGRTFTRMDPLDESGRVQEIARMLSGSGKSPISMKHARELIRQ
jgi:DNA repair protein RecN (Recombination protein N)